MKINIKTRMDISVHEVKKIGFKDIKTINFMEVNRQNIVGDNIKVKRI